MISPKSFATISIRILLSTLVVCAFFVVTQDLQIFPRLLDDLSEPKGQARDKLPKGIRSDFVTTNDDEQLEVWFMSHIKPNTDLPFSPVALIFHGNGENVKNAFGLQVWLGSLGIVSYSFDYRGYGRSTGWPSDSGLKEDVRAVIRYVESQHDLEEQPLLLVGSSIGSGLAAYGATIVSPKVLALLSPYSSLRAIAADLPGFSILAPFVWYDIDTEASLAELTETCLVLAHGEEDRTIQIKHTERLVKSLEPGTDLQLLRFSDTGHNDLFSRGHRRIGEAILHCFMKVRSKQSSSL